MARTRWLLVLLVVSGATPLHVTAQEYEVTRRTFTFIEGRLHVNVVADMPGEVHVVRGERGRIEVAARSLDGFPGFALGGRFTPELRLTAVGAEHVRFLVVVPEAVAVSIDVPGRSATLSSHQPSAVFRWGGDDAAAPAEPPLLRTLAGGLYLIHSARWAPASINLPSLAAIRSLSVRVEGGEFRIAASRPLALEPGSSSHIEISLTGEPLDLVITVPRGAAPFVLQSGSQELIQVRGGTGSTRCSGAIVQSPTPTQQWVTLYPQAGAVRCRP